MKSEGIWEDVSVDLCELIGHVENFLRSKGLKIKRTNFGKSFKICVGEGDFCVEIIGNSRKFKVVVSYGNRLQHFKILGPTFSLFFGGGIMLKSLRAQEFFEKLERELWDYLSRIIDHLNGINLR
ncbi:MAG: hypothetical protein QXR45_09400 [Candidatus Bathyarchaeia archaeon]